MKFDDAPALVASSGVFKNQFFTMKDTYPQHHPCWWFDNYLPEPYRSQAIENYDLDFYGEDHFSLRQAIRWAFPWKFTPEGQGYDYWRGLFERAEAGEFNTPLL